MPEQGNKALSRAERETREALNTVEAANKMKEVFLHTITQQIEEPLNVVVGLSKILAVEEDLPSERIKEYSASIKKNSDLLSQLIIDVLDLSRLESGMMKFNLSTCDAVQLCLDAKMAVEMREHPMTQLTFMTDVDTLTIHTDAGRFLQLLLSVLSAPKDYTKEVAVKYALLCENSQLKIIVKNSPLLDQTDNLQHIKREVNRLYLEIFKGVYQVSFNQENGRIIFTHPSVESL